MNLEDSNFPKINRSRITGRKGITILKDIVENKLNWLFRENHLEDDFGIDGHIDIITDDGKVTGKSLAFQLKTGESYFEERNEIGYVFRGENKHINYYLNYSLPILIIIINPISNIVLWELFDATKTDRAKSSWKMTIPENKMLNTQSKDLLLKHIGPITDYSSQLDEEWRINELLKKHERIIFQVPKSEIVEKKYQFVLDGLERIHATSELLIHVKNKVDISIDDYEFDERELFEIPEVKEWIKELYNLSNCWPYLMAMDRVGGFMTIAFICHLNDVIKNSAEEGNFSVEFNPEEALEFVKLNWHKLNEFSDDNNISEQTNKEISNLLVHYFISNEIKLN